MYPPKMKLFMGFVVLIGVTLLVVTGAYVWTHINVIAIVMAISILVASIFGVKMLRGNGSISVQLPVLVASGVILGPAIGAWLGFFFTMDGWEWTGKVKWPSVVFNRAQYAISGWAAGEVFYSLGGSLLHLSFFAVSVPLTLAAIVAFLLNWVLVMAAISLRVHRPIWEVLRAHFKWSTPTFLLMIPVAYGMAAVYQDLGPYGELIFIVPLATLRYVLALLRHVNNMYKRSIDMILEGLNMRDSYTYGHSVRVGHYAGMLASYMGLAEDRVDVVHEAGLLHDIGKLGTHDSILRKAGRLNREEQLTMKEHPVIGSQLLEAVHLAGCSREFVRQHHERWDGRGYPDNLEGTEIAVEARIISVVDAYDAMTTDRPYRRAMPHAMAMAEIEKASGEQFDPAVVEKFIEMCQGRNLAQEEAVAQRWKHTGTEHAGGQGHGQSG
ncbi:MAG: HD-GYP domain-containing protein [Sulfobacillus thermosulfidooxidans]|nr:MAG: HD-GYP domain-containing protein [Sulfobacillus thermosulfidooxidans]